jgi:hypothetical protein
VKPRSKFEADCIRNIYGIKLICINNEPRYGMMVAARRSKLILLWRLHITSVYTLLWI